MGRPAISQPSFFRLKCDPHRALRLPFSGFPRDIIPRAAFPAAGRQEENARSGSGRGVSILLFGPL